MVDVELVEFTPGSEAAVIAVMAELGERADGRGWLTIDPGVLPADMPPPQSAFGRIAGNRGPYVPRATWVPAVLNQRRPEPVSVGILHAAGQGAVRRLEESGIDVPERWRIVGDHPKRGIVAYVPVDIPHLEVLRWVMRATAQLSRVPLTGEWRAAVHRR